MRKMLAITLVGGLLMATFPSAALAGDSHAVSNRWAGAAIGAASVIVGGFLLNALQAPAVAPPVAYAPPPVVYSPPPVAYTPPTVVYYAPPPVVYAPAPVVVHRSWGPPGHSNRWQRGHARGWDRD
jgi:hypothetical protein